MDWARNIYNNATVDSKAEIEVADEYSYSQYLMKRSRFGSWYRNFLLYPVICRQLRGRVLDYGCGIGDFLRFRSDTIGVDINIYNCEYCRAHGHDVVVVGVGGVLPFKDRAFDGIVLDNVLEHIPENMVPQVLQELGRVIQPQGSLIVGVPGIKGYSADPDHKVHYTKDSLVSLLVRYGFTLTRSFYMPIDSRVLEHFVSAHCLYGVFQFGWDCDDLLP